MDDQVTIKFVEGPTFGYFRGTICGNAPGSIFDHHFNVELSFNIGNTPPTEYILDRSHEIFNTFIDLILRGYHVDDKEYSQTRVKQDLEYYNIRRPLPPGFSLSMK